MGRKSIRPRAGTCRLRAVTPIEFWLTSRPSRKGNRVLGRRNIPEGIVPNRRSRRLASAIQARCPPCSKARSGNRRPWSRLYLLTIYDVTNSHTIRNTSVHLSIPAESLQTASKRPRSGTGGPESAEYVAGLPGRGRPTTKCVGKIPQVHPNRTTGDEEHDNHCSFGQKVRSVPRPAASAATWGYSGESVASPQ